jgi:Putative Actinobacterial Holin-X, holin superfamily III
LATREPTGSPQQITAAIEEVSQRAQLLVREEIELAKTEVQLKIQKLVKGAVVGAVAGVFVIAALVLILHGLSWLAYWLLPVGNFAYFWGFFLVAAVLLVLGGIAGFFAARFFKSGSPPKPDLAIEEAQRIRDTVQNA